MTEFSRPVPVDRIGAAWAEYSVAAEEAERTAVARRLMIPGVDRLACRFRLRRATGGTIEAEGWLDAGVRQVCIVSLDEFEQTVAEAFSVQFVPEGSETQEDDPDAPDQVPYVGGAIDLGEAAAEQLALALDPYPKKPGAVAPGGESAQPGAFAGLAALRGKQ